MMDAPQAPSTPPPPYEPPPPLDDPAAFGGSAPPPGPAPFPWERPGAPTPAAFFESWILLLTHPGQAFQRVSLGAPIWRPLLFGALCVYVGAVFTSFYEFVMRSVFGGFMPSDFGGVEYEAGVAMIATVVAGLFLSPILLLVGAVIWHLLLLLVGSGRSGFLATLRVTAYASAPSLLGIVPMCGGLIAGIWQLVLLVVGMAVVHRASMGRVILALVLTLLICCLCCIVPLFLALKGLKGFPF